jgi:prophage tail gpP-like protein
MTAPKVTVSIDQKDFVFWEEIAITRSLDNFSTIELSAPFEPNNTEFRNTFVPFSFKPLEIRVDDQLLFNGQLVGVEPRATPSSRTVRCSGYSLPAQLVDATMPASEFPIEYGDHTLLQIAEALCKPFGVTVAIQAGLGSGPQFKRARIQAKDKIAPWLANLARARGIIMRDDEAGHLVFLKTNNVGRPAATLREGESPVVSVAATFSPQSYYSEITGLARTKRGRRGSKYTETNKNLPDIVRPLSFTVGDVNAGDLPGAVKAKMARMFGNMVSYVVEVPTWRDASGTLWQPNTTVTLEAPAALVYRDSQLIVRDVILRATASSVTASLGLILPGGLTGEQPEQGDLPWG